MSGMGGMSSPPPPSTNMQGDGHMRKKMMMHMTFFWDDKAEILFSRWPGTRSGMYAIEIGIVFFLAFAVEFLSHCRLVSDGSGRVAAGLLSTLLHALRLGLAYLVMLAVMSFNGGVFLVAVAGHTIGFLLFGSKVFWNKSSPLLPEKPSDLPPCSC